MGTSEAADLIRRYKDASGLSQTAIAHELSQALGKTVLQSTVSLHLRGSSWTLDLPGAYVKVLGIPPAEMAAAMGYPVKNPPKQWTIADVVKADPTLSAAAKKHLLNQYELLQMATLHERSGDPVLKKARHR